MEEEEAAEAPPPSPKSPPQQPPEPPQASGLPEEEGAPTEGVEAVVTAPASAAAEEEEEGEEESTQQSPAQHHPEEPAEEGEGRESPPCPSPSRAGTLEEPAEGEALRVSEAEAEALRLKSLAEEKYRSGAPLKAALKHAKRALRLAPDLDGLPQMVTALRVLRAPPGEHYRALLVEPFSHLNTLRRQYKALALALHPDKNTASLSAFPGSEDAFKRVGEAFQVLSDRARRREYDVRLRVELEAASAASAAPVETFWTACTTCRLFHQFDRRYAGQRLLCPRCRKSFLAVEVRIDGGDEGHGRGAGGAAAANARVRAGATRSARSARAPRSPAISRPRFVSRAARSPSSARSPRATHAHAVSTTYQEVAVHRKRKVSFAGSPEESRPKRVKEKTLAEIQLEVKKKSRPKPNNLRAKDRERGRSRALVPCRAAHARDLSAMAVEDSDFYDFDKHRTERSFRRGQIWAVYDDDDGMPRHYGLVDEVLSTNPFRVKMSWLDIQSNGDEALLLWEKQGLHISCGRFRVGRKVDIDSVNFFSHLVDCEQAAKELFRIYPRKGSIWALYSDGTTGGDGRRYDIVVLLTSFSEMYGLSMAYLVKVEGFRTVFKRREVGVHAIKWLEKNGTRLFSHQIPARKLSGSEGPDLPSECWELDPASLPPDLLRIDWKG
uniref:Chaperone protein dnaJ 49 n=1 Tax=Anthurium amnicola TaxID=1678845 RepID=A0A1D1Y256_9ARAE